MDQTEGNLSILNLSLENPCGTLAGAIVLREKIPLGEVIWPIEGFDPLEATPQ